MIYLFFPPRIWKDLHTCRFYLSNWNFRIDTPFHPTRNKNKDVNIYKKLYFWKISPNLFGLVHIMGLKDTQKNSHVDIILSSILRVLQEPVLILSLMVTNLTVIIPEINMHINMATIMTSSYLTSMSDSW